MSKYSIKISLSDATLEALYKKRMSLIIFKGVTGPPSMNYIVWFKKNTLSNSNKISWVSNHSAYLSDSDLSHGVSIDCRADKPMSAGQLATVTEYNTLQISNDGGVDGYYNINNPTDNEHTVGLATVNPGGVFSPCCATLLNGNSNVGFQPMEGLFLCFGDSRTEVGTVWVQSVSAGFIVDLTDTSVMNGVVLKYDINKGWSCAHPVQALHCVKAPANESMGGLMNSVSYGSDY